jgi:acyl carrier protein
MTSRVTIEQTLVQVASEMGKSPPMLGDDVDLIDTGLDSLGIAVVVARLEDALGVDPFGMALASSYPVTVGDLIHLYEQALAERAGGQRDDAVA